MILLTLCLLLILSVEGNQDVLWFLTNKQHPVSFFQCVKETGYTQIIFDISDGGKIDAIEKNNVNNAKNAGLTIEINYTPYWDRMPENEVASLIKNIGVNKISRFWIDPQIPKPTPEFICEYLQRLVTASQKNYGIPMGINTDDQTWSMLFQAQLGCPQLSSSPLWWYPTPEEQNLQPDFENYDQIGGWKVPFMKFYSSKILCKEMFLVNYNP